MEGMKTAEKARLMLLLKEKEKLGDKTPFEDLQQRYPDEFADEKEETDDNREEAPTTPIL
jgi:hypothetical protein